MASSRLVAAGETYTPDDINNLRADVLDPVGGHRHNGVDGARVPFSHLDVTGAAGSSAPPGGSKSYNDLANHVASSQGVHGLPPSLYVAGSDASGMLLLCGRDAFVDRNKQITFAIPFDYPPVVVITMTSEPYWGGGGVHIGDPALALDITESGFRANFAGGDGYTYASFNWIAMGVKTA